MRYSEEYSLSVAFSQTLAVLVGDATVAAAVLLRIAIAVGVLLVVDL